MVFITQYTIDIKLHWPWYWQWTTKWIWWTYLNFHTLWFWFNFQKYEFVTIFEFMNWFWNWIQLRFFFFWSSIFVIWSWYQINLRFDIDTLHNIVHVCILEIDQEHGSIHFKNIGSYNNIKIITFENKLYLLPVLIFVIIWHLFWLIDLLIRIYFT